MRVVAVFRGERIVIRSGVSDLLADIHLFAVNCGGRCAIDKAIQKRRSGIFVDLMEPRSRAVIGLRPVVVLERDNEDSLHLLRAGGCRTGGNQRAEYSDCAK